MSDRRCDIQLGPGLFDVQVIAGGVNLVDVLRLSRLEITVEAQEPPTAVLHLLRPGLSANEVRWSIPEEQLRWLAETHGFNLVKREDTPWEDAP